MKKNLRILIPIILGVFFLYITFVITSQEERLLIFDYIKSAKIEYLLLAMFLGASSDIVRGLRWQLLSKAIGYNSGRINSIASVFMCYASNMAIPRSGEVIRATVLSEYNKIPIGKAFGTIAAERVIDMCISITILFLVWALQYEIILESFFEDNFLNFIDDNFWLIFSSINIVIVTVFILILKVESIKRFFKSVLEGFLSLTKLKGKLLTFILLSFLHILSISSVFNSVKKFKNLFTSLSSVFRQNCQ